MKRCNLTPAKGPVLAAAVVLAAGILTLMPGLVTAQPPSEAQPARAVTNVDTVRLESSIPTDVRWAGVAGREYTYHLDPSEAPRAGAVTNLVPLQLGSSTPLAVQSVGVVWRGDTCHLVRLGSIKFELDNNDSLKADIHAGVLMFDDVDYDISGAVFDAAGQMLGVARAQCKVKRMWAGDVKMTAQTIRLDFGVSLDYGRAASFMVSVSNRKVLTPDDWQK